MRIAAPSSSVQSFLSCVVMLRIFQSSGLLNLSRADFGAWESVALLSVPAEQSVRDVEDPELTASLSDQTATRIERGHRGKHSVSWTAMNAKAIASPKWDSRLR